MWIILRKWYQSLKYITHEALRIHVHKYQLIQYVHCRNMSFIYLIHIIEILFYYQMITKVYMRKHLL